MLTRKPLSVFVLALTLSLLTPFIQDAKAQAPSIAGKWAWFRPLDNTLQTDNPYYITVSGNQFEAHLIGGVDGFPTFEGTVNGYTLDGIAICDYTHWGKNGGKVWRQPMTGTVSSDGNTLTFRFDYINRKFDNNIQHFRGWETYPIAWELRRIG